MIDFAGINFENPLVIASSPLTRSIDLIKKAEDCGAAAVSTKLTFTKLPFECQLRTCSFPGVGLLFPIDKRLEEKEGLELVRKAKEQTSLIVFANITSPSSEPEKWAVLARKFEQAGTDLIELNLCCSHIGLTTDLLEEKTRVELKVGATIGRNPSLSKEITKTVERAVNIPVVCKPTSMSLNLGDVVNACEDGGADGLTIGAGTGLALPPVDVHDQGKPLYPLLEGVSFGSITGGRCNKYAGYGRVALAARNVEIPIVGSGGIETWEDTVRMIMWGATLVGICTSVMWKGFEILKTINKGLEKFIEEGGYSSPKDFRGLALKYLTTSDKIRIIEGTAMVDKDKCTGCGRCLKPGHCTAIELDNGVAYIYPKKCIGCSICVSLCPEKAITMKEV